MFGADLYGKYRPNSELKILRSTFTSQFTLTSVRVLEQLKGTNCFLKYPKISHSKKVSSRLQLIILAKYPSLTLTPICDFIQSAKNDRTLYKRIAIKYEKPLVEKRYFIDCEAAVSVGTFVISLYYMSSLQRMSPTVLIPMPFAALYSLIPVIRWRLGFCCFTFRSCTCVRKDVAVSLFAGAKTPVKSVREKKMVLGEIWRI